jgi:hypothetical protein
MQRLLRITAFLTAALVFPAGASAAGLSFSPSSLNFGAHALGESKKLTATLKNATTKRITLTGASVTGNNPTAYSFITTCGASLATGESCAYAVTFKSTVLKPRKAQLEVTTGDPANSLVKLSLRGNLYPVLNDTGIETCGNSNSNGRPCPVTGFPRQDAQYGRDKTVNKDANGHAGFNFTKLDTDGKPLPASASEWDCVRDNVTGLIWERKPVDDDTQGNQGLHDADDRFTWYNTASANNGGSVGYLDKSNNRGCSGYNNADAATYCNTEAYVNRVNVAGWCGAKDWRMPTRKELRGLIDLSISEPGPTIDRKYFPDAEPYWFWSSSAFASGTDRAWYVSFENGLSNTLYRDGPYAVRLVRGGQ